MWLEEHSAPSVAERWGLSHPSRWYRWKSAPREQSGPVGASREARVQELEVELARVTRERDILNGVHSSRWLDALVIFGRSE